MIGSRIIYFCNEIHIHHAECYVWLGTQYKGCNHLFSNNNSLHHHYFKVDYFKKMFKET